MNRLLDRCNIAIYTVLGSFHNWEPASYIIEDYKDANKRKAFGITGGAKPEVCTYSSNSGDCAPFSTPVAEYALALHKHLYTKCLIHLTFFTPLTLLDVAEPSKIDMSSVDCDTILGKIRELSMELGEVMGKPSTLQEIWSPIISSLSKAKIVKLEGFPLRVVVADTEGYSSDRDDYTASIKTYFVPIPLRLNQRIKNGPLIINYADLESTEIISSAWINATLEKLSPKIAILDTTHGVNYATLLIDRAFRRAVTTLPANSNIRVQVYNTDPVTGKPSSQATYKYHLIEDKPYVSISVLTRSPPDLASTLREYIDKISSVASSLKDNVNKEFKKLLSSLEYAARSFNNDVILWGYIYSEKALRAARNILTRLAPSNLEEPWLEMLEEIKKKGDIVYIYQFLSIKGDKGNRSTIAAKTKLLLVLEELQRLLRNANMVWREIIEEYLGLQVSRSPELRDDEPFCIVYCRKEPSNNYPEYLPAAAYILLGHELREGVAKICCRCIKAESLDRRNFIAHGGLSRGIVSNISKEEDIECYRIDIDVEKLKEALDMIK